LSAALTLAVLFLFVRSFKAGKGAGRAMRALALALAAFIPAAYGGWFLFLIERNRPNVAGIACAYTIPAILAFAAFVLAVVAFFQYGKGASIWKRRHAVAALFLSFAYMANFLAGAAYCVYDYSQNAIPAKYRLPDEGARSFSDKKLNFSARLPEGWARLDAAKVNDASTLAIGTGFPQIYAIVIAENPGVGAALDTEELSDAAKTHMRDANPGTRFAGLPSKKVGGVEALCFEAKRRKNGKKMVFHSTCLSARGFMYQILFWTKAENKDKMEKAEKSFLASFKILDDDILLPPEGGEISSGVDSEEFGFSVKLPPKNWSTWGKEYDDENDDTAVGFMHLPSGALFFVDAFLFDDLHPPSIDAIAKAFFGVALNLEYTETRFDAKTAVKKNGFEGYRLEFSTNDEDSNTTYVAEILKGDDRAFMACALLSDGDGDDVDRFKKRAEKLMDGFSPSGGSPLWEDTSFLPPRIRRSNAMFFNQMGLYLYNAKAYRASLDFFVKAFHVNPDYTKALTNALIVMNRIGMEKKALQILGKANSKVAADDSVKMWKAWFLHQQGRNKEAVAIYAPLFDAGYRDDEDFDAYVEALAKLGKWHAIVAAAKQYDSEGDEYAAALSAAETLLRYGRANEALEVLDALSAGRPLDPEEVFLRMDCLNMVGDNLGVLLLCSKLLDANLDSAALRRYQGDAERAIGKYGEAADAYRKSLALEPGNKNVENKLTEVLDIMEKQRNDKKKETK